MTAPHRTCPSCKIPIPEGALFCSACGEATPTEISEDSAIGQVPEIDSDEIEYTERDERLDVVSETGYVAKGASVRLIRAEGYRHVVEPVETSLSE